MNEMRTLIESIAKINEEHSNQEIVVAYKEDTRSLEIRGEPTSLGTWHRIMSRALAQDGGDGTYNDFDVNEVAEGFRRAMSELGIGETDIKFIPCREYSVALYVTGETATLEVLGEYIQKNRKSFGRVDEINVYEDGGRQYSIPVLRLWWD